MQDESNLIVVGNIAGVYGIKGWFKILSFTRPIENIFDYRPWLIKQNDQWQTVKLSGVKPQGKGLIAAFEGISDRTEATALVGLEIAIERKQLPEVKQGEFYWHDLISMQVINNDNETLGVVTGLLETGANDVLVVEADKQRHLIPYVQGVYIKDIDIVRGVMQVDWQSDY